MYKEIQEGIAEVIKRQKIIAHPSWVLKVVQLYETSLVRHGFMLVGPTASGKTEIINTLVSALSDLGNQTRCVFMNPKAITAQQVRNNSICIIRSL